MTSRLILLAAMSIPALVGAQTVDPDKVPEGTKITWCDNQMSSCPILCSQTSSEPVEPPQLNNCSPDTLIYQCVCADGTTPNATEYSETIPYYLCTEANTQCVERCQGSAACQSACREDHPCGAKNPTRVNTSTVSTMSATATATTSSAAGDVIYTGFAGSTPTTVSGAGTSAARVAVELGRGYGLAVVAAGVFAGFAVLL